MVLGPRFRGDDAEGFGKTNQSLTSKLHKDSGWEWMHASRPMTSVQSLYSRVAFWRTQLH